MLRVLALALLLFAAVPAFAEDVPLDQRNAGDELVVAFLQKALPDAMTFSHATMQADRERASKNFSDSGWGAFLDALDISRIPDRAAAERQTVTADLMGKPPAIEKTEVVDGRFRWVAKAVLGIKFAGDTEITTQTWHLQIVVERVETSENPQGFAIRQWLVTGI